MYINCLLLLHSCHLRGLLFSKGKRIFVKVQKRERKERRQKPQHFRDDCSLLLVKVVRISFISFVLSSSTDLLSIPSSFSLPLAQTLSTYLSY